MRTIRDQNDTQFLVTSIRKERHHDCIQTYIPADSDIAKDTGEQFVNFMEPGSLYIPNLVRWLLSVRIEINLDGMSFEERRQIPNSIFPQYIYLDGGCSCKSTPSLAAKIIHAFCAESNVRGTPLYGKFFLDGSRYSVSLMGLAYAMACLGIPPMDPNELRLLYDEYGPLPKKEYPGSSYAHMQIFNRSIVSLDYNPTPRGSDQPFVVNEAAQRLPKSDMTQSSLAPFLGSRYSLDDYDYNKLCSQSAVGVYNYKTHIYTQDRWKHQVPIGQKTCTKTTSSMAEVRELKIKPPTIDPLSLIKSSCCFPRRRYMRLVGETASPDILAPTVDISSIPIFCLVMTRLWTDKFEEFSRHHYVKIVNEDGKAITKQPTTLPMGLKKDEPVDMDESTEDEEEESDPLLSCDNETINDAELESGEGKGTLKETRHDRAVDKFISSQAKLLAQASKMKEKSPSNGEPICDCDHPIRRIINRRQVCCPRHGLRFIYDFAMDGSMMKSRYHPQYKGN